MLSSVCRSLVVASKCFIQSVDIFCSCKADDGKVVSGSYDHSVKVWDLKTSRCQLTLRFVLNTCFTAVCKHLLF